MIHPPPITAAPPIRTRRARRSRRGFTLMQMLVSISLTTVLLLLVSRVFNDTGRTIADSMDISQVLATTRVVSDALLDDGARIITAKANEITDPERADEPAAFMVMVMQRNSGVRFPEPGNNRPGPPTEWTADADGDGDAGEPLDDLIRTDQLIFFRSGANVESLTPATDTRYDSDARGLFTRVWYGHVSPPIADGGSLNGVEPGEPGNDDVNRLTLGRQSLLILDDSGFNPDDGQQINRGNNATGRLLDARGGEPIVPGFRFDTADSVVGVSDGDFNQLYEGATDVLAVHHPGMNDGSITDPGRGWNFRDFFEYDIGGVGENPSGFYSQLTDGFRQPNARYRLSALSWGFLENNRRLIATSEIDYPYSTEQVGRTHGFFAAHISDFATEFAADITDDLGDDPNTSAFDPTTPGPPPASTATNPTPLPITLDNRPDQTPDTISTAEAQIVAAEWASRNRIALTDPRVADYRDRLDGSIKWYTADHLVNNPVEAGDPARYAAPSLYPEFKSDQPLTWAIPVTAAGISLHSNAPLYPPYTGTFGGTGSGLPTIGIIEPLPATNRLSASTAINDRAVFVFGHAADVDFSTTPGVPGDGDDPDGFEAGSAKWWPYLIRVRYRLHDGDGSFGSTETVSGNQIAGKWFEQIIPVPRK